MMRMVESFLVVVLSNGYQTLITNILETAIMFLQLFDTESTDFFTEKSNVLVDAFTFFFVFYYSCFRYGRYFGFLFLQSCSKSKLIFAAHII